MNDGEMKNFDLVEALMKRASGIETKEEGERLDQLIISGDISHEDMEQANNEVESLRALLPLIDEDKQAKFPEYARERLQTKVKETFKKPLNKRSTTLSFLKFLVPISAAAFLFLTLLPTASQPDLNYHYATLDLIGTVRGEGEKAEGKFFPDEISQTTFSDLSELDEWKQANEGGQSQNINVTIVHDKINGNLEVSFMAGSEIVEKTVPIEGTFEHTLKKIEATVMLELENLK